MAWLDFRFTHQWNGENVEYRPLLDVEIVRGSKSMILKGLVDSGCETSMINTDFAPLLGVNLEACQKIKVGGVGGSGSDGYTTKITMRIDEFDYQFESPIIFADIPSQLLLGQNNFFEHFKVLFERDKGTFSLSKILKLKH